MKKDKITFTGVQTLIFLSCLAALSTGVLVYSVFRVNSITHSQSVNYDNHFRYHIANDCFRQGTDLLTEAVRRYVVTMKGEYIESYFNEALEERHRDRALAMVRDLQIDPSLKEALDNAMKASNALSGSSILSHHLLSFHIIPAYPAQCSASYCGI